MRARSKPPDGADAVAHGLELFDQALGAEAAQARAESGAWRRRAPAVVAGGRKLFEATEVATADGAAGLANDLSELETVRVEMERHLGAYSRMLDQLSTAVAIFDRAKKLTFYNAAYRQIWSLDPAFLDSQPTNGEILDRLRATRQLPEQADFRGWKAQALAAYQAIEPIESVWHLPDGRALRVVASPNPQGGVTYLFDDATQSYALASQVNALTRVQGETLDALKEGVAVFGADGRMKLINPAFAEMWRFDPARARRPAAHRRSRAPVRAAARRRGNCGTACAARIVGLHEERARLRAAGSSAATAWSLDCAALPLPDGATLLTFLDVTASANVERALTERNQALIGAEKLRNDFVNHVSYELRTPLTNIIGFTQLLADGGVGPLNPAAARIRRLHHQFLGGAAGDHQRHSRSRHDRRRRARAAGSEDVDVVEAMKAAAEGVQDRLSEFEDRAAHRRHRRCRLACAPTAGASARCCSTCSPTRSASPRRARR